MQSIEGKQTEENFYQSTQTEGLNELATGKYRSKITYGSSPKNAYIWYQWLSWLNVQKGKLESFKGQKTKASLR